MTGRPARDYESLTSVFEQKAIDAEGSAIGSLKKHFLPERANRPFSGHKYYSALLVVTASPNIASAIEAFENGAKLKYTEAEKAVLDAVNNAPSAWRENHAEELISKGLIRGEDFFHRARPAHMPGSTFDEQRSKIAAQHQPLLLGAIDATYKHINKYGLRLSDSTLTALAVQLLPDGEEKQKLVEKLSKAGGKNGLIWQSSAKAIETIAQQTGIDPQTLPYVYDPLKSPEHLAGKAAFAAQKAAKEEEVKNDPQGDLKRKLDELVTGGAIDSIEKEVYLYAVTPRHDGILPSEMHTMSKFSFRKGPKGSQEQNLRLDRLRQIMEKVPKALMIFEQQEQKYASQLTPESP